jgi:hypothetical protein
MSRCALILLASLAGACSNGAKAPETHDPKARAQPESTAANAGNEAGAPSGPLSFIPAEIASKVRHSNTLIALDAKGLGLARLASYFEGELPCSGDLLRSVGVAVIGESEGFITKLPEKLTRDCLATVLPALGGSLDDNTLAIGSSRFSLTWTADTAHVRKLDVPATAALSKGARKLVAKIPAAADFWVVSEGYPKYSITKAWLWIEAGADVFALIVHAESDKPDAARDWLAEIPGGFIEGARSKGINVDDKWFKVTAEPGALSAKLEGRIPTSIFSPPKK